MTRALSLARNGEGYTSPNPMVGAVIVARGKVIGEGYHRRYGGPHAEVWAVRSVTDRDRHLLKEATVYVTLEPCSHYGKTPPCAGLLVDCQVKRVVIGCLDPNPKVSGRGVAMLRNAGIEVKVGVLSGLCRDINRRFIVAQTLRRPYVLLKWACSSDGYLDARRSDADNGPVRFSTTLSLQTMHRLRSRFDAILVGSGTVMADDPTLTVRNYHGRSPRAVVIDRRGLVAASARVFSGESPIYLSAIGRSDLPHNVIVVKVSPEAGPAEMLQALWRQGISSVMVEGGASLIAAYIRDGLWDDARIERAPWALHERGVSALPIPAGELSIENGDGQNVIINVKNPDPQSI